MTLLQLPYRDAAVLHELLADLEEPLILPVGLEHPEGFLEVCDSCTRGVALRVVEARTLSALFH